ncbi:hypothetical protein [Bacillus sp. 2205SS5-2]|uniref:hypothetical protein n=1 Tax=Bacillus sp. 2205SS5-2 TaxID=3109031 RepID=UPI0030058667
MKSSQVMLASLESYSFDPSLKPLQLVHEKRKWLAQGRQASGRTRSEACFT